MAAAAADVSVAAIDVRRNNSSTAIVLSVGVVVAGVQLAIRWTWCTSRGCLTRSKSTKPSSCRSFVSAEPCSTTARRTTPEVGPQCLMKWHTRDCIQCTGCDGGGAVCGQCGRVYLVGAAVVSRQTCSYRASNHFADQELISYGYSSFCSSCSSCSFSSCWDDLFKKA